MARGRSDDTREYGRSVGMLTISLGTAGLLAYAFFAVASHTLSRDDYGQVVVLWSAVFLTVSVLFRPVEQLLTRSVAEQDERVRPVRQVLRVAATVQLGLALAFIVLALSLRNPIEDKLFNGDEAFLWLLLSAVLAFAGSYYARGYMAGRRHMVLYGALLVVDGVARLVFALLVAVGIATGAELVAIGIAISPLLSLAVVPFGLRRGLRGSAGGAPAAPPAAAAGEVGPDFTLAQGGGFAAAVLVIMLSEQAFLNSGPLFAQAEIGPAAAGFIFNILMVARAPVVLFQAVAASLLPHLTRLRSRDDAGSRHAFDHSLRVTLTAIVALAIATCLGLLLVGPQVMQVAFGDKFEYDRFGLVLVGIGMGFYLAAATLNQAALAQGKARIAAACWLACAAGFIAWNLTDAMDVFRQVEVGFAVGAAALCACLLVVTRRAPSRPEDVPEPGSTLELELASAAADEVG